ncbi:MAG: HAMP domain-containing histidine kinase [Meiothermus silvanus]|nr:HAMP domain-containing histidine kinase [Allomeiothermus silvanus]
MSFRVRLTLIFTIVWGMLVLLAALAAQVGVTRGLFTYVQNSLLHDTEQFAKFYSAGLTGTAPLEGTGNINVSFYDLAGNRFLPREGNPEQVIPKEVILTAGNSPRIYTSLRFIAAYQRVSFGIIALSQDIGYIYALSDQVARSVALSLLFLLPVGVLLIIVTSQLTLRPLQEASRAIQNRGPENLSDVKYPGPPDELGRIVDRVNSLLFAVREARERERAFLAEVSHELRTPLTSLTGYLERLSRNPAEQSALEGAKRTTEHLTRMVGDLLALARGEAERSVNAHIVSLGEVLKQVVQEYPGVSLRLPKEDLEVLGDPDRLMQLARNLISNAVRAAERPQGVRVMAWRENLDPFETLPPTQGTPPEGWAVFAVRDDGPGIDPEILPRLFQRFARGPQGGTGLGLAIARQIAMAHGGKIEVTSKPGDTRFTVYLPLLSDAEED